MPPLTRAHRDDIFFTELAKDGFITRAAKVAGIDRSGAYKLYKADPEFAERWDAALDEYHDKLEEEARRRAVDGSDKGVWHQGVQVGTEKQYSDSLLALMLKAKRKKEYGDASRMELANAPGESFRIEESPTQITRRIAFVLAAGLRALQNQPAAVQDDGGDLA